MTLEDIEVALDALNDPGSSAEHRFGLPFETRGTFSAPGRARKRALNQRREAPHGPGGIEAHPERTTWLGLLRGDYKSLDPKVFLG